MAPVNPIQGGSVPRLWTLDEVAQILRLSKRTLREPRWITRLEARKVGRDWRVMDETLQAYLTEPPK